MAANISLQAVKRDSAKTRAKDLRAEDLVPGVLYGYQADNQPLECKYQEFHKVYVKAGESTVIDLEVDGKTFPVLIHDLSLDPVSSRYEHVDFFAPDMSKEITAKVPIRIEGESPGVKDQGGILVTLRDAIEVKCLPRDLPSEIIVDISNLKEFHESVIVSALSIPASVTVLTGEEEMVVTVQPPRKEEEVTPVVAEGEEGAVAEGEAAPAEGDAAAAAEGDTPASDGDKAEAKKD
jgi:large subunit ribosomal protein L25